MGPDLRPRVAVLGATGCVGRHLCEAFAASGCPVLAVSRRYVPQVDGYRFRSLDVAGTSSEEIATLLAEERIGVVVNATLGWGPELHYVNVRLVERLLGALRRMSSPPRLIQLGTIHEYGPVPRGTSIDEEVRPDPRTPYAKAKLTASGMVLDAIRAGQAKGVVLRVTNTIGPHPATESFFGSLATTLRTAEATTGVDLTIADAHRDYVDVRDAADAVMRASLVPLDGTVINIGRGEAVDIRSLVHALVEAAGLPLEALRERSGLVDSRGADWIQVDISRAGRLLGWRPRYSVAESMRAMWDTMAGERAAFR